MVNHRYPPPESLIPEIGSVSQAERMFRVNWVASMSRTLAGTPLLTPDFVARQGRSVRLVDVREPDELTGALGYIPGSDWIPRDRVDSLAERIGALEPVVLISRGGERASELARELEARGLRFVAAMNGGVIAWRDVGFTTTRDPAILTRRDVLHPITPRTNAEKRHLSRDEVAVHVGDPLSVRWVKMAGLLVSGRLSCVDGRDDSGVIGTPGGDLGETVLVLSALEKILGRTLDDETIDDLLCRRLDVFGRFYFHTDISAANTFIATLRGDARFDSAIANVRETMQWRRFMNDPPAPLRPLLLEKATQAEHLGCGHVKGLLTRSDEYGVRSGLVGALVRAFFGQRWEGQSDLEYVALPGGHGESAVLNVRVNPGVFPFSRIPLVSPSVGNAQVFVNHPQVARYLRHQLVSFLALQTDLFELIPEALEALSVEVDRLAAHQLAITLGKLAKGLPIYDVTFDQEGTPEVIEAGVVP